MSDRVRDAIEAIAEARAQREQRPPSLFDPPVDEPELPRGNATPGPASTPGEPRHLAKMSETQAIRAVGRKAGRAWSNHVLDLIRRVATTRAEITVDDIAPLIEWEVHDLRALGPVMKRAAKLGYLRQTGDFKISERPDTHSRPLRVWASCLYESRCAS